MKGAKWIVLGLALVAVTPSFAEPTSGQVKIVKIRPYLSPSNAGDFYVTVNSTALCSTNTFLIPMTWGGAKEAVAVATAALISGKNVQVEIVASGCATPAWTTIVQSIYLLE